MGDVTVPVTTRSGAVPFDLVVRPRRSLVRSTLLSVVFSAVPLAVALVWVSVPLRLWTLLASIVVVLAVVIGIVFVRLGTAYVGVDALGVTLRGVLAPNRRVTRDRIAKLVLATTYCSAVDRSSRELVALDERGRHAFRMRADVWGDAGLDQVVEALGVQVSEDPRPVSARAFAKQHPTSRSWYEQRGTYLVVGIVAAVALTVLVLSQTVDLIGG